MLVGFLLVAVTVVVGAALVGLLSLRLWRQVQALGRSVGAASRRLDAAGLPDRPGQRTEDWVTEGH